MIAFLLLTLVPYGFGDLAQEPSLRVNDPIAERLESAKELYRSQVKKARDEIFESLKAKEKQARGARDKKLVDQILSEEKAFQKPDPKLPISVPVKAYRQSMDKAVQAMRVSFEKAIGDYVQAGKDREAAAVERSLVDFKKNPEQLAAPPRARWKCDAGHMEYVGGEEWVWVGGPDEKNYREVGRNSEYIELYRTSFKPERKRTWVRLYQDRYESRDDDEEFKKLYEGGWVATAVNPPVAAGQPVFEAAQVNADEEKIRGVIVKVGDPQFTLIWDSTADLDLHVIEPGGKEIYWLDTRGRHNGQLDIDSREGFGPENIYWPRRKADSDKPDDLAPSGDYRFFVHYYRGFGGSPIPTRWRLRVRHEGRTEIYQGRLDVADSRSKIFVIKIGSGVAGDTKKK